MISNEKAKFTHIFDAALQKYYHQICFHWADFDGMPSY